MAISVSTPADLLASVPACLGFTPTESVLILGLRPAQAGSQLHYVCRADLPEPGIKLGEFADALVTRLAGHGAAQHMLAVVSDTAEPNQLPHRRVLETVQQHFATAGMAVSARYWLPAFTPHARWRSYDHPHHGGILPDPRSTVVAAELAAQGEVTFDSRDELAGLLAPVAEDDLDHRATLLAQHSAASRPHRREQVTALRHATEAAAQDHLPNTDEDIAALLMALVDPVVRDVCIAWNEPGVEHLWTHLTRHAPGVWAAEPAALLTVASYRRGAGALSNVACQRALDANPEHRLATLLAQVQAYGMHPCDLDTIIAETTADTHAMLD